MDYPAVGVLLLTYEDGERQTAHATLEAVIGRLKYSGPLHLHISDDGSREGHVASLVEMTGKEYLNNDGSRYVPFNRQVTTSNAERRGYGHSYNLGTQALHERVEMVLVLEDDWVLSHTLDLDPLVETLALELRPRATARQIGAIRLGYLGFTQPLAGEVMHTPAGPMLYLDPTSAEPHVAAGHPRLETVAYQRSVGPWSVGMAPGATEVDWCTRYNARQGVAWPLDLGPASMRDDSLFVHTGAHGLGEIVPEAE